MTVLAKQTDRFTETDIDDEIVVMRLDTGEFFSIAGTGAAAWRLIDGKRDRAALLTALAEEFDGVEAEMANDIDDFLAQLKELGLVAA
jgi:pyrroloquinoline quinone biosynthesis protein D